MLLATTFRQKGERIDLIIPFLKILIVDGQQSLRYIVSLLLFSFTAIAVYAAA